MDRDLFNATMRGLLRLAGEKVKICGIADSLRDLLVIKEVIMQLQIFYNDNNQLTNFNWILEFNKIVKESK
jgi:hypothetical protein